MTDLRKPVIISSKPYFFSFPLFFFSFSSPFSPTFRSIVSFSKQSFAHCSHAIRSPSARRPLVVRSSSGCHSLLVCPPSALFACRPHVVRTFRTPSASCPVVLCALSASCPRVFRTLRMPLACRLHCPRVVCELSARPPCTVCKLSARPPCTARRSPSLCCSFSQNQIKKVSK